MNSLEAEYSFLMPTWKLPSVSTPSMYSRIHGGPYLPSAPESGPDWSTWNNTVYNSRYVTPYVPSTVNRRAYPATSNYQRQAPGPQQQQYHPQQQQHHPQHQQHVVGGGRSMPVGHRPSHPIDEYGTNGNADDGLNLTISLHPSNEYDPMSQPYGNRSDYAHPKTQIGNRTLTYATNDQHYPSHHPPPPAPLQPASQPAQKRRVQIIDHNRQTPSTMTNDYASGRESHNSNPGHSYSRNDHTPEQQNYQQPKYKPTPPINQRHNHVDDRKHDSKSGEGQQHANNSSIHEYLYGLSAPDAGSYVNAYKNQRRRLHDEKTDRRSVMTEYKTFVQNGGFGPAFGSNGYRTYDEKIDTEKKKKYYSKAVQETNHQKIEQQKRLQNNGGQERNRTATINIPKQRRSRPWLSSRGSIISPILPRPISAVRSTGPLIPRHDAALHHSTFDRFHPWYQSDLCSGELYLDRSPSISSSSPSTTPPARRVRFHSRDFIRRRSSTFIDMPSHINKSVNHQRADSALPRVITRKSAAAIFDEKHRSEMKILERLRQSVSLRLRSASNTKYNRNKDNINTVQNYDPRSRIAIEMRTPPTVKTNNEQNHQHTRFNSVMTTRNNSITKPILMVKSPDNLSKITSRNVRFGPDVIVDESHHQFEPTTVQRPLTAQSSQNLLLPSTIHQHQNSIISDTVDQ